MVEQRPLAASVAGAARLEPDVLVRHHEPVVVIVEAEPAHRIGGLLRRRHPQHHVVDVVVRPVGAIGGDQPEPESFRPRERSHAMAVALNVHVVRQPGERRVEVVHAKDDALERPGIARPLGGEERQLAAACVRSDERELVGAVDLVHPEVVAEELREGVAIGHP